MKIHTGDVVVIMTGKDKGKQGTVTRVLETKSRVVVEGINMRTRHIKKTAQGPGQRVTYEASIHVSNVAILDPKTKKPTRIGYKIDEKTGRKSRIAKASGEVIVKAVTKAATEKSTKKSDTKDTAVSAPKKQAFWKKTDAEGGKTTDSSKTNDAGGTSFTAAHRSQGG
ncbi:50S ribosomal protein L24 [Candidatus Peribacteria bacterium]|nr:MAG: 50S ribosomal protein L24 [Candidatus Peribacteria bacterium]